MKNKYTDILYVKKMYSDNTRIKERGEFLKNNINNKYFARDIVKNKLLKNLKNNNILDVGCGNGHFLNDLYTNFPQNNYFAFDIIKNQSIELFKEWLNFRKINNSKYPIYKNKFDLIFCFKVLYHIHDLKKIFVWMMNNLNKNGKIFITTKSIKNFNMINCIYKKIIKQNNIKCTDEFLDESNFCSENIRFIINNFFHKKDYKINFFDFKGQIVSDNYDEIINYIYSCPKYHLSYPYLNTWKIELSKNVIFIDNYKETLCVIEKF